MPPRALIGRRGEISRGMSFPLSRSLSHGLPPSKGVGVIDAFTLSGQSISRATLIPETVALRKITMHGSGTPIIYDSAAWEIASDVLYSAALTDGQVVTFSPALRAVNGLSVITPIGSERITNGAFDTDTSGWTAQLLATLTNVSQTMRITTAAGAGGRATQLISGLTSGKSYVLRYDFRGVISGATSGGVRVTTDAAGSSAGEIAYSGALLVAQKGGMTFTAAATSYTVALLAGTDTVVGFDDVSLVEVDAVSTVDFEVAA